MTLKRITYATEHKGVWACTDCPWESEETDFLRNPRPPDHVCPKREQRPSACNSPQAPTFDSSDE
jgi:hypothetical protein